MRHALLTLSLLAQPSLLRAADVPDFSSLIEKARALAGEIVGSGAIPGLSMALVDGDRLVWADGFGLSNIAKGTRTTAATVYRVGSISKVFTAIGVMQLVEKGKVDLDRPLADYFPELGVENPFLAEAGPVKPRQVFSHVSGMPRESPVGSYFDGSGSSPAQALASLHGKRLVHPPGRVTKYSNIAVSLMGSLIERVSGSSYMGYETKYVLEPLGLKSSAFLLGPTVERHVATGYMQERDRRLTPAPVFELATIAAGNLYSSVEDLARFARMLHARGEIDGRRIVEASTLEKMWTKQFPDAGGRFGIGFVIGERFGEKSVEHNGAVYGFSSVFICVPSAKVSVILLANEDIAFGPLKRLTDLLLGGALAIRKGGKPVEEPQPAPLARGFVPGSAGAYRSDTSRIELRADGKGTLLVWNGHSVHLEPTGLSSFITRDRLMDGNPVVVEIDSKEKVTAVIVDTTRFLPFEPSSAPVPPKEWAGIEGDYGPPYLPVRIRIREGRIVAECETFEYEPAPRGDGTFVFPRGTLYEDELLSFERGPDGKAAALHLGTMRFERLAPFPR